MTTPEEKAREIVATWYADKESLDETLEKLIIEALRSAARKEREACAKVAIAIYPEEISATAHSIARTIAAVIRGREKP
jgi:hypothetical protein